MKTYIVSGIEPAKKGAGRFLNFFITEFQKIDKNVNIIFIKTPENKIVKFLKGTIFFEFLKELYYLIYRKFVRTNQIENASVIIFHPQSLGVKTTINLISRNDKIYFYVLDNFFFCIKSYNHLDNSYVPCFYCLKDIHESNAHNCKSSPNNVSFDDYKLLNNSIIENINKITFLTQNTNQTKLLLTKYGKNAQVEQIGMNTGEISVDENVVTPDYFEYDFLYHNTLNHAKGINYFVNLAQLMPDYTFVIPYPKAVVEKLCNAKLDNVNLLFVPCSWETGLRELILKSRITIVPSLWSAPIEGSLLKSMFYANAVAVVKSEYSFSSEIPENLYIQLSENLQSTVLSLESFMKDYISQHFKAKEWVISFLNQNTISIRNFIAGFK